MTAEINGFVPGARPVCVFCNTPWTDDMIRTLTDATLEIGYYGDPGALHLYETIDITCKNCKRLIYRKEIAHPPNYGYQTA